MLNYSHTAHTDMWGAVTNIGYKGMLTSLGIVWMLIHCLNKDMWQISHVHTDVLALQTVLLSHEKNVEFFNFESVEMFIVS